MNPLVFAQRLSGLPTFGKVVLTAIGFVVLLSPIDLWPDFLPFGSLDDSMCLMLLLGMWSKQPPPPGPSGHMQAITVRRVVPSDDCRQDGFDDYGMVGGRAGEVVQ